jgi:hypothetical protein
VLHPRYKLKYFKLVKWEQEWIDAALDLVRLMYNDVYSTRKPQHTEGNVPVAAAVGVPKQVRGWLSLTAVLLCSRQQSDNIFDNLPTIPNSTTAPRDELDRYLHAETENVVNALAWWTEKKTVYPCLSRMALDFLSIPGIHLRSLTFYPDTLFSNRC